MKKKRIVFSVIAVYFIALLNSCASIPENAKPIEDFDVNRYLGTWYEVARFDFRF